jgi:uncharacterized protein YdeI (YjbR/CyaY-like superfamily)
LNATTAGSPRFFATAAEFRAWLEAHHASAIELWVGFQKKGTGRPSLTWPESVAEALCFGWIDGVRKSLDAESYVIRFTPRKPDSIWSAVNLAKMDELIAGGRVAPAGLAARERRTAKRSAIYAYEQRHEAAFDPALERRFRAARRAWSFFAAQPPGYRRLATYWVASAKREETRARRLAQLIECSAAGERLPGLARPAAKERKP